MLEKEKDIKLSQLCAILLMEEDFNAANKTIFGNHMLYNAHSFGLMPHEIFSEKHKMTEDGIFPKFSFMISHTN